MPHPDNPIGPFKSDLLWVIAFVVHSLCSAASRVLPSFFCFTAFTVVGLCTDHPAALAASFGALLKGFSR